MKASDESDTHGFGDLSNFYYDATSDLASPSSPSATRDFGQMLNTLPSELLGEI